MIILKMCSVEGCGENVASKKYTTLCPVHLYRWNKYKSYDLPDHLKPEILPDGIVKKCKNHGYLKQEDVGASNKCLACSREYSQRTRNMYPEKIKDSNKRQRERVIEMIQEFGSYEPKRRVPKDREIIFEKTCPKHGVLKKEQIIVRENGYLRCKACHFASNNAYRKRNPEKTKETKRRSYLSSPNESEKTILRNKRITKEQYIKLINEHNNKCAICYQEETKIMRKDKTKSPLCVDHNHETGKIRGLLCHRCNSGIGFFKENESFLLNAIDYLRKYNGN